MSNSDTSGQRKRGALLIVFPKALRLVAPGRRRRWGVLVLLGVLLGVMEAGGAYLIYLLLKVVTNPSAGVTLPVVADLADLVPASDPSEILLYLAGGTGAFFLLRSIVFVLQGYVQHRIAYNEGARLSTALLETYLSTPYSRHVLRDSSELIRNAHESANQVVQNAFIPGVTMLSEALVVLALLIVLFTQNLVGSLLAIGVLAPVAYASLLAIRPTMSRLGAESQKWGARSIKSLQQSLGALADIRILGVEEHFVDTFREERFGFAKTRYLQRALSNVPRALIELAVVFFILGFIFVDQLRGNPSAESLAFLGLFGYAALRMIPSFSKILQSVNQMQFAEAAIDDVSGDLERHPAAARRETVPVQAETTGLHDWSVVQFDQVSFTYESSETPALAGVDLSVPRGSSLGIVGATGSGKSTIVGLVTGLLQPTTGAIYIGDTELRRCRRSWQDRIGLVPQSVVLLDETIRRNVALGIPDAEIDTERVWTALEIAQVADFVRSLPEGLDSTVGDRGVRISGGQRQRIVIARALYRDPDVLIFDEGTSALDRQTEEMVTDTLMRLRGNRTIFVVAHRIASVRDLDEIIVIDEGRIVDRGDYDTLLARSSRFRSLAQ